MNLALNESTLAYQEIYSQGNPVASPGGNIKIPLFYNNSTGDTTLTGVGARLHYNSNDLTFINTTELFATFGSPIDLPDTNNLDNNPNTNRFVQFQYVDFDGNWPNRDLPLKIGDFNFRTSESFQRSQLNLSRVDTAAGYSLRTQPIMVYESNLFDQATKFTIEATNANQPEGNSGSQSLTFTIIRTGNTTTTHSVNWAVNGTGSTPATGADFVGGSFPSGTINFAAGEISRSITINVIADSNIEPNETFVITLSNPSNNSIITTSTATGTIQNDDDSSQFTNLAISPNNASQLEGNTAVKIFTFDVTRTGVLTNANTVNWVVNGTGSNPANAADFGGTFPFGTLNFSPGETSQTIIVNVSGDSIGEPNENFNVTLSNPVGARITTATATGTIENDDVVQPTNLAIAPGNAVQTEGNTGTKTFTFSVTRAGDIANISTVNWAVSGTGTNPADAADFGGIFPSGTLNFQSAESSKVININVSGDTLGEPNETFGVTLSNPSAATITIASATGTIENDDADPPTSIAITAANSVQAEGNTGTRAFTFTVTRTGNTSTTHTVNWAVIGTGNNPATAADFGGTLPSGTLNFQAGETSKVININVNSDTTGETDETFTVTLSNASNNATISTNTATGTIQNDDDVIPPGAIRINDNFGNTSDRFIQFGTPLSQYRAGAIDSDLVRPALADTRQFVDLTNDTIGNLIITNIQVNAPNVSLNHNFATQGDIVLNPGGSRRINLTYSPTSAGEEFDLNNGLVILSGGQQIPIRLAGKSTLNADISYDGLVGFADLGPLNNNWGRTSGSANWDPSADMNGDGSISFGDLGFLNNQWGT